MAVLRRFHRRASLSEAARTGPRVSARRKAFSTASTSAREHLAKREQPAVKQPHQIVHVALRIRRPARCVSNANGSTCQDEAPADVQSEAAPFASGAPCGGGTAPDERGTERQAMAFARVTDSRSLRTRRRHQLRGFSAGSAAETAVRHACPRWLRKRRLQRLSEGLNAPGARRQKVAGKIERAAARALPARPSSSLLCGLRHADAPAP